MKIELDIYEIITIRWSLQRDLEIREKQASEAGADSLTAMMITERNDQRRSIIQKLVPIIENGKMPSKKRRVR